MDFFNYYLLWQKSTGKAIGYDDKLNPAFYNASQASGMKLQNYGIVFATVTKKDREEALPLFTSLDTVKVLLDVLDETTLRVSTINAN